mmetsp:Transcript_20746/g.64344  ORF Transcript_20746/g.64344 Transcript_20746/m.64344 type:complete len:201 (-) Transcript_20746:49-651(-)
MSSNRLPPSETTVYPERGCHPMGSNPRQSMANSGCHLSVSCASAEYTAPCSGTVSFLALRPTTVADDSFLLSGNLSTRLASPRLPLSGVLSFGSIQTPLFSSSPAASLTSTHHAWPSGHTISLTFSSSALTKSTNVGIAAQQPDQLACDARTHAPPRCSARARPARPTGRGAAGEGALPHGLRRRSLSLPCAQHAVDLWR